MIVRYKVLRNQSLTDISVQELGSALALIDLAKANNLSPTAELQPGQLLIIPDSTYKNKLAVDFFKSKGLTVATRQRMLSQTDYNDYLLPGIFPLTL